MGNETSKAENSKEIVNKNLVITGNASYTTNPNGNINTTANLVISDSNSNSNSNSNTMIDVSQTVETPNIVSSKII